MSEKQLHRMASAIWVMLAATTSLAGTSSQLRLVGKVGRGMRSNTTMPFAKQHLGRILHQHCYQSSEGSANQRLRYARYAAAPAERPSVDAPIIRTRVRGERVDTLFGVGEVNVTADRVRRRTV